MLGRPSRGRREFEVLIMSVETDSRTVCGRVLKEVLGFRPLPVLPEQFPVRRFPIPCYFIRNPLLFRNRELSSNHLKYRRLPRQKTAGSAQKWPKFPVFPCYSWLSAALLHGPEQIADLPVPVAESPGAVRIGHPERSHLVEYLAPNSVFNSLPRQRSSPHLRPDDRLVTIDRVLHHASLGVA